MGRIEFDHVTKAFDDTVAVRDFTLEVEEGEFLVLVGPSGCGKSTTLRMLAGLEDITSGTISIDGRVVNRVAAKDRDIAMVFQTYALYPHMSVADNMAFGLKLRHFSKEEVRRRVQETAHLLGLEALLARKPGQLSGGQRQRVALGRAIVREPAVFLLDEPLSNLDAQLRVQTRTEISRLHRRLQTTFVYVTHDQVEAMTMATRIAVMNLGELQQVGSPQELYDHPANIFVAGFIGSPSMNFFRGIVRSENGHLVIDADGFTLEVPSEAAPALASHEGRQLTFGVRPEHIHDPAFAPSGLLPLRLAAEVEVMELMGNETFLHLRAGDSLILARVDPRTTARTAESHTVLLDASHLRAFDPDAGLPVALGTER